MEIGDLKVCCVRLQARSARRPRVLPRQPSLRAKAYNVKKLELLLCRTSGKFEIHGGWSSMLRANGTRFMKQYAGQHQKWRRLPSQGMVNIAISVVCFSIFFCCSKIRSGEPQHYIPFFVSNPNSLEFGLQKRLHSWNMAFLALPSIIQTIKKHSSSPCRFCGGFPARFNHPTESGFL